MSLRHLLDHKELCVEGGGGRIKVQSARGSQTLTLLTDIMLVVSVPVLSEQITEVQPRVSTDGRLRTMAFLRAILRVPNARQVVMTAVNPSGMAATANATAILK